MKRFLVLSCLAASVLSVGSSAEAQILRRRLAGGCGTSNGCSVSSGGCNVSAARGCNLSAVQPASVAVPLQAAPLQAAPLQAAPLQAAPFQAAPAQFALGQSAPASSRGGSAVEDLFRRAAGCPGGACPLEPQSAPPAPGASSAPLSARIELDTRQAMAFCSLPALASGPGVPGGDVHGGEVQSRAAAQPTSGHWSQLVGAFR